MRDIWDVLTNGSSVERLSVISNISTVLGVSVATFVAGPFLSHFSGIDFVVLDFLSAIFCYLIFMWFFLYVLQAILKSKSTFYSDVSFKHFLKKIAGVLFLISCFLYTFPWFKYASGNALNNVYLLPKPGVDAVESVYDVSVQSEGEVRTVKGKVKIKDGINLSDYVVVIYYRGGRGLYEIARQTNYDYYFSLAGSGSFTIPIQEGRNYAGKLPYPLSHVVVYRSSDWNFWDKGTTGAGFPNEISQVPNSDIDKLKPYIIEISL